MSPLTHPERVAVARLHALLELLPTALDKQLAPTGLTSFEYTLLEALAEADGGRLRLSALASRSNATLPRLSRVVTGLERKGHVLRAPCEQDGRATNAVLTEDGRRVLAEATPLYADAVRRMILDGLDDDGVDDLARLSYAVLDRLDPDRRLAITAEAGDAAALPACAADPAAASESIVCAADPVPRGGDEASTCAADPAPSSDAAPAELSVR